MEIRVKTEKPEAMRYRTCGDYWTDNEGVIQIRVAEMENQDYCFLVALHEMIEEFLTRKSGIKEEDITNFDIYYEKRRDQGLVTENAEPGFDSSAPYKVQHSIATGCELIVAASAGIDWKQYEETINSL